MAAAVVMGAAFMGAYMLPAGRSIFAGSSAVSGATASGTESALLYTMRTWEGKIGVFRAGASSPYQVLDVYVETLPREEQEKLTAGIPIYSEKQLQSMIDNYTS